MKFALPLKLAALATAAISTFTPLSAAQAASIFDQQEVDQGKFVAVASPFDRGYTLIIIEQIPGKRTCWSEGGSNPIVINPLWDTFDFSGICRRNRDSNGYSIRVDNDDLGLDYLLNIVQRNGELLLVGTPRVGVRGNEILVGRTNGIAGGVLKINLEPGWRFTKRAYQGKTLGHVYFTRGGSVTGGGGTSGGGGTTGGGGTSGGGNTTLVFRDIARDIYKSEIEQAVKIGFIAGFPEDNTFRPLASLTREQLVSMVFEAVKTVPNLNITAPSSVSAAPFPDVPAARWSAAKIKWARDNQIVQGYPEDGTFRPTRNVTRAELAAVMKKAAQYVRTQRGQTAQLTAKQSPVTFSDVSGHWAANLVREMSAYCNVASPLNESGTRFAPNTASQRNYAATATLRTLNCVKNDN